MRVLVVDLMRRALRHPSFPAKTDFLQPLDAAMTFRLYRTRTKSGVSVRHPPTLPCWLLAAMVRTLGMEMVSR